MCVSCEKYSWCASPLSSALVAQYATLLPDLLEDGVRGMIYAGDQDLICNWLGNRRWVDQLDWSGASDWNSTDDFEWAVHGSKAGLVHESGPLSFVKVYGAGHMVRHPFFHQAALIASRGLACCGLFTCAA